MLGENPAILGAGRRLFHLVDMGEEFVCDRGDGLCGLALAFFGGRVFPVRHAPEDALGFVPCLLWRDVAMRADLNALRATVAAKLRDIRLLPRGEHVDPEAEQRCIPAKLLRRPRRLPRERVDRSLGYLLPRHSLTLMASNISSL